MLVQLFHWLDSRRLLCLPVNHSVLHCRGVLAWAGLCAGSESEAMVVHLQLPHERGNIFWKIRHDNITEM